MPHASSEAFRRPGERAVNAFPRDQNSAFQLQCRAKRMLFGRKGRPVPDRNVFIKRMTGKTSDMSLRALKVARV
jgi:hypothetical protein